MASSVALVRLAAAVIFGVGGWGVANAQGDTTLGCDLSGMDKTPPAYIHSVLSVGNGTVEVGADKDVFAGQSETVWHVVQNRSGDRLAVEWRDPETQRLILLAPFTTPIPAGGNACAIYGNKEGAFEDRPESELRLASQPRETRPILFYRLAGPEGALVAGGDGFTTTIARAVAGATGPIRALFASMKVTPTGQENFVNVNVSISDSKLGFAFGNDSFVGAAAQLKSAAAKGGFSFTQGPMRQIARLEDNFPAFESVASSEYVFVSGASSYEFGPVVMGDAGLPILLTEMDGSVLFAAALLPAARGQ